jgi:hypothetical protein
MMWLSAVRPCCEVDNRSARLGKALPTHCGAGAKLMRAFGLTAEDLGYKWMAYAINKAIPEKDLTLVHLESLWKEVRKIQWLAWWCGFFWPNHVWLGS